ncbi:unnamed protein product [Dicrocoelium dendriticum]|nr:unnamed protein product [Dicrocoelium dendriticum]
MSPIMSTCSSEFFRSDATLTTLHSLKLSAPPYILIIGVKEYNFQGTCTATEKTDDIGARGLRLKPNLFAMVSTQTLALALYTHCRSVHWIIALPAPFSILVEILLQFGVTFANSNTDPYNCIQLIHRYYTPTDNTLNDLNGTIYCTVGCQRDWSVHHIRGTNLKLLVADRRCPVCDSLDKKLPSDPVEGMWIDLVFL